MKTDLTTLKNPSSFKLRGIDIDVYCVDGHVMQIWLSDSDGEKYMVKSIGYLDICKVDAGSVLDIPLD